MTGIRQLPTAPCSLLRDGTEGSRLVGSYPTAGRDPAALSPIAWNRLGGRHFRW